MKSTVALIVVAVVLAVTVCLLPKDGFWIVDNANKFLQVRAKLDHSRYDLPWPGAGVDPLYRFNPLPEPFSQVQDGKLYSIFSPVFAAVSSVFFSVFGFTGLYLLPLLGSLLLLAGVARLVRDPLARTLAVVLTGLCTPVWFYSVTFWEHAVAVAFCVWALYLFRKFVETGSFRDLVIGSVLAALSIYFRDELYLFCAVLLGITVFHLKKDRLKSLLIAGASMAMTIVPLWLFQGHAIGKPFGFHVGAHLFSASGMAEHLEARPTVLYSLFAAAGPSIPVSLALALPFLVMFVVNPKFSGPTFVKAMPLLALVALVCGAFQLRGYFQDGSPIVWMLQSNSLFTAAPVLMLAFVRKKDGGESTRFIWITALAYAVVYGLAAPLMGSTGIHWGNRFVLLLYPLLCVPAAVNTAEWLRAGGGKKVTGLIVVLVMVATLAAQAYSIRLLYEKKRFSQRANQQVQRLSEETVITSIWWAPQELYSEFYGKSYYYFRSPQELDLLLDLLGRSGCERYVLVTRGSMVDDGVLDFFSLKFSPQDM
jgi:hypothetical protein